DLKSIQTLTGCGGGSSSCKQFCTFCPQHSELRGQPSLKRCPCCLVNDPGQEFECHHHAFLGGADIAGVLPTQTARESAQEVCASSRSLLVATSGLLNMSTALSKAAKKAVGAARAADLTTFPARARAPLALQALHSVEAAVAASVELLAAVARAQASVSAEARLASDGGITPLIVGPVSQTALTDTTAVIAAFAHAGTAFSLAAGEATAARVQAEAWPVIRGTLKQTAVDALSRLYTACRMMEEHVSAASTHCGALHQDAEAARVAAALAPISWAVDVRTIIARPHADAPAAVWLAFAQDVLCLTQDVEDKPIQQSTDPQVRKAIAAWYLLHDVYPDNVKKVPLAVLKVQLKVRPRAGDLLHWMAKHMVGQPLPGPQDVAAHRAVLVEVLYGAYRLEHLLQPRYFTSERFLDQQGKPKRWEYFRDIELFVLCILHAEMRIGEKLINMLLGELRLRKDLFPAEKLDRWKAVQLGMNRILQAGTGLAAQTQEGQTQEGETQEWGDNFQVDGGSQGVSGNSPEGGPSLEDWGISQETGGTSQEAESQEEGGTSQEAGSQEEGGILAGSEELSQKDQQADEHAEYLARLAEQDDYFGHYYGKGATALPEGLKPECATEEYVRLSGLRTQGKPFKMDLMAQRRLWPRFDLLLDIIYREGDPPDQLERRLLYSNIASAYGEIFVALNQKEDMTTAEVYKLQLYMDQLGRSFVTAFGRKAITNYAHNIIAGMEALIKVLRSYSANGTQHGGHCGNQRSQAKPNVRAALPEEELKGQACMVIRESGKSLVNPTEEMNRLALGGSEKLLSPANYKRDVGMMDAFPFHRHNDYIIPAWIWRDPEWARLWQEWVEEVVARMKAEKKAHFPNEPATDLPLASMGMFSQKCCRRDDTYTKRN
ncbi:hypothetical protein B484DRAFT_404159, partial [Ochromonadaceae sp. CCMP2298]